MKEEITKADASLAKESKKEVSVPAKFKGIVDEISNMSVIDLSELVGILEDKFGVSAATPVAMVAASNATGDEGGAEEKSSFTIEIASAGATKIAVIKVVREITELGLKDAKDLVDAAPKVIKENVAKAEAEAIKKQLEQAGATVNLK